MDTVRSLNWRQQRYDEGDDLGEVTDRYQQSEINGDLDCVKVVVPGGAEAS